MLFRGIGEAGQQALADSHVLIIGCGALGCVAADTMTRAGVGRIRIVDRDFVELTNLQRQVLYTEEDVASQLPKAIAAADRLRRINSQVQIEPIVADADFTNIRALTEDVHLILDGTDNFEVRYLINDVSLESGIPWIFTGCTGSHGQMMPVLPGRSACLRCLMPEPPPPGSTETCDTAGVLGPAIGTIASLQAAAALRLLTVARSSAGDDMQSTQKTMPQQLTIVDVWDFSFRQVDVSQLREHANCPACARGERLWLDGSRSSGSTVLCGRNAVQISPADRLVLSLPELQERLVRSGTVTGNRFLVRVRLSDSEHEITVFPDGRAIIKGTEDPAVARSLYSRHIGS
ncbi:MAG: ThiF family adenylyltransferase [Planctomycetaceae bacterium]|nr:ThiF family adenylyltransferase [Planctomycetaceae bacterium]